MPRAPEQEARKRIDAQLEECGWIVQHVKEADFTAGRGIALPEVRLKSGACDYLLLVDRKPGGGIEAKKEGTTLSIIADQSTNYAENLPEYLAGELNAPPPFRYESTGVETPATLADALLRAFDPDAIAARASGDLEADAAAIS